MIGGLRRRLEPAGCGADLAGVRAPSAFPAAPARGRIAASGTDSPGGRMPIAVVQEWPRVGTTPAHDRIHEAAHRRGLDAERPSSSMPPGHAGTPDRQECGDAGPVDALRGGDADAALIQESAAAGLRPRPRPTSCAASRRGRRDAIEAERRRRAGDAAGLASAGRSGRRGRERAGPRSRRPRRAPSATRSARARGRRGHERASSSAPRGALRCRSSVAGKAASASAIACSGSPSPT